MKGLLTAISINQFNIHMIEKAKNVCEKNFQSIQMESVNASFGPKTLEKQCKRVQVFAHNCGAPDLSGAAFRLKNDQNM